MCPGCGRCPYCGYRRWRFYQPAPWWGGLHECLPVVPAQPVLIPGGVVESTTSVGSAIRRARAAIAA